MNKTFFSELLDKSRLLLVLYDNLPDEIKKDELYHFIETYLEKYALFNNISVDKAVEIYTNFITIYNRHCKQFNKTGKYPAENGSENISFSREEYDIVLLLSVLFTTHRFRIMQILNQKQPAEKALFIGLGPGLELALTKDNYKEIHAYDVSVNKFLSSQFSGIEINAGFYTGQKQHYFDAIYMIELLEHVTNPFELLEICYNSLRKDGKVFLTTATDIPQFDHLYNFPKDHIHFEEQVRLLGFSVLNKEMVPHNYLLMDLKPSNQFYTLIKS